MESEEQWFKQYQTEDLARALIRQYMVQSKLSETLKAFEVEDTNNYKKITKSVLIKMLSMTSLFTQNKTQEKPYKTLLQVLVSYLRNKFRDKVDKSKNKNFDIENQTKRQQRQYSRQVKSNIQAQKNQTQPPLSHSSLSSREPIEHEKVSGQTVPIKAKTEVDTSISNVKDTSFDKKSQFSMFDENKRKNQKEKTQPQPQTLSFEAQSKNQTVQSEYKPTELSQQQRGGSRMTGMRKKISKRNQVQKEVLSKPQAKQQKEDASVIQQKKEKSPKEQAQQTQQQPKNSKQQKTVSTNAESLQLQQKSQKEQQGKKMVSMFGKKKKANAPQQSQPQKFKFDQNFVDKPLHVHEKYNYQKMSFDKITIATPQQPEINYKEKISFQNTAINKKKNERFLTESEAKDLKKVIFQYNTHILPKSWHQGFILSPFPTTPYGLKQIQGGPCGIIAAMQCYYLKHLLYISKPQKYQDICSQIRREIALVAALTDILMKVKSDNKIYLTLPPRSFSGSKLDIGSLQLNTIQAQNFKTAFQGVWNNRTSFIGQKNHGVTVLLYSIVMTKGCENITNQIDCKENPLIGNHGHCTQELVNLFITGIAASNCFDGVKTLQDDYKLRGIENKGQFGFLTIFQTLKYIEVGKNLKKPVYPFWIICKQFHYHVIFANHYLIAENNDAQKFDMVYFDGLYNCGDKIILTLQKYPFGEQPEIKIKELPLIEQVMMTKWGQRKVDWNGSIKIL